MPNVSTYLIAALVVVALLAGAGYKGYELGRDHVRAEYEARDIKAQADYAAKETALQDQYRKQEANWQAQFVSAARTYEGKVKENAKAMDIALASGRLYDRFASTDTTSGDSTAKTPANPSTASQTGTELSEKLATFLESEASRADKVVLDLNLCIDTLQAERQ